MRDGEANPSRIIWILAGMTEKQWYTVWGNDIMLGVVSGFSEEEVLLAAEEMGDKYGFSEVEVEKIEQCHHRSNR